MNALAQFRDAMQAVGLEPPNEIVTGKVYRFPGVGKSKSNKAGWCTMFTDGLGGSFGDWASGLSENWQVKRDRPFTPREQNAFKRHISEVQTKAKAELKAKQTAAANKAAATWQVALPAPDGHPYLARKGIKAHGAKLDLDRLVIPMHDGRRIRSLQYIPPRGKKLFLRGGQVSGCYYTLGTTKDATALCIVEGFATGATVHEATGHPVVVAFTANNLEAVAQALRKEHPDLTLVMCADDDAAEEGNPGLTKARAAARAVGGLLAVPDFRTDRPEGATDFNDMAAQLGNEAVQRAIAGVIIACGGDSDRTEEPKAPTAAAENASTEANVTDVTDVHASSGAIPDVTAAVVGDVTGVTDEEEPAIPNAEHRPHFKVFDDWTPVPDGRKLKPGVWFFGIKAGKGDAPPTLTQQWICSPVHVEAVTFDAQDNNFGRLLRFRNTLKRWRDWAMPMELLRAGGDELRGELLAMGVEIDPQAKTLLAQYLQAKPPKRRVNCALQVGWCGDSFVLPDIVIGANASNVIFQSGERGHDEHTRAGTLAEWQAEIAARAIGNPMLTLALSASFAGPMLERCNGESGGIHFVGDSSTGKTTAIEAACSTWGGARYRRSWRATANGMEGAAAQFNDCLLALDEISECDPKEVGAIVYALGTGAASNVQAAQAPREA